MPKLPIDYSKGIIYRIVCNDVNVSECYIGSTTNLVKRRSQHKENLTLTNKRDYLVYQFIRDNGGWDNWNLVMIERYPCEDKLSLLSRERTWIEHYKSILNKQVPTRTRKEYYQVNKDTHCAKQRKNYEDKKEEILIRNKRYYEDNKESIAIYNKEYRKANIESLTVKKKVYNDTHKEQKACTDKIYREKNKEAINMKKKEKHLCECGKYYASADKRRHERSKYHIDNCQLETV